MIRFLILFSLLFAFDWYVFQAFQISIHHWDSSWRYLVYGLFWMVPLLFALFLIGISMKRLPGLNKESFTLIRSFFFLLYASKLIILTFLLTDDVRRAGLYAYEYFFGDSPYDKSRSLFLSQIGIFTSGLPLITLTYGILRNRHRYQLHRVAINLPQLPEALQGLKVIQISDIHSGSFTEASPLYPAIDLINEQHPDIVVFTGDLVNSVAEEMQPFIKVFKGIKAKYGVYSVLGNHDYGDYTRWNSASEKQRNFQQLIATHREMGWDIMLNEHRVLEVNGEKLALIGVENYSAHPRFPKYGDLQKASEGLSEVSLKILLSHDPSHWEEEVTSQRFNDIDLTLSGHTHGFQFGMEIPGWFKWSPAKYVYKHWAGLYQQGHQYLYVNRGFGYLSYPGRVGILPEITLLEFNRSV